MQEEEQSLFGLSFVIPERVAADEFLYVCRPPELGGDRLIQLKADLTPLIESGLATLCKLESEAELDRFVELARRLDDGEAECLAVAKERGWLLATDDRLAISVANELGVEIVSTASLIRRWSLATQASDQEMREVLRSIQLLARFTPSIESDGGAWWHDLLATG